MGGCREAGCWGGLGSRCRDLVSSWRTLRDSELRIRSLGPGRAGARPGRHTHREERRSALSRTRPSISLSCVRLSDFTSSQHLVRGWGSSWPGARVTWRRICPHPPPRTGQAAPPLWPAPFQRFAIEWEPTPCPALAWVAERSAACPVPQCPVGHGSRGLAAVQRCPG